MILTLKRVAYLYILLLFCFATVTYANQPANDVFDSSVEMGGYAWSSNIGWISLDGSNYGVDVTPGSGALSGYAWSSNIGWIQFGGLSGCPSGSCPAYVDVASSKFHGWARALSNGGGWDGWISLSSDTHGGVSPYGIEVDETGTFTNTSYAWGSDVIGWTSFSTAFVESACSVADSCSSDGSGVDSSNMWCEITTNSCSSGTACSDVTNACEAGDDELTVSPSLVKRGQPVDVSWTTFVGVYSSCRVESPRDAWVGLENPGVESLPVTTTGTVFTLYCVPTSGGAEVIADTAVVNMVPVVFES